MTSVCFRDQTIVFIVFIRYGPIIARYRFQPLVRIVDIGRTLSVFNDFGQLIAGIMAGRRFSARRYRLNSPFLIITERGQKMSVQFYFG